MFLGFFFRMFYQGKGVLSGKVYVVEIIFQRKEDFFGKNNLYSSITILHDEKEKTIFHSLPPKNIFHPGLHGESKLSAKQNIEYVQQLLQLYWARYKVLICILLFIAFKVLQALIHMAFR